MSGLTVSAAMTGLINILWAPMAGLTVSAVIAGLTILWYPMADLMDFIPNVTSVMAGLTILWALMDDLTDFPHIPIHRSVYVDLPPSRPVCPPPRYF